MKQENIVIRQAAKEAKVPLWAIANFIGKTDGWFTRKLRKPLSDEETARYLEIIKAIAAANAE